MTRLALIGLAIFFCALFARGLMLGVMPSRFGTASRRDSPIRFAVNRMLIAALGCACLFGAMAL
ncbi:hypothetical protein [Sphingomonas sp. Leaf343]|uniref:hypothetical protein n=1 Tax=Sphingomonas sp. Leaf343 TaxID=1736345 RepID=UPI0012E273E8|nr:hypothetical protein [Sphingomonas sp. Leaf343]